MNQKSAFILLLFLLLSVALNSCKKPCILKDHSSEISGIIISEFDFDECFSLYEEYSNDYPGILVNDDSTYQALPLRSHAYREGCLNKPRPNIDFTKYTLLGLFTQGGCDVYYRRKVEKDDVNKRYIYSVKIKECGVCKKLMINNNWVLVPKLPTGYTVQYERKQEL